jgi:hypothetical protein
VYESDRRSIEKAGRNENKVNNSKIKIDGYFVDLNYPQE